MSSFDKHVKIDILQYHSVSSTLSTLKYCKQKIKIIIQFASYLFLLLDFIQNIYLLYKSLLTLNNILLTICLFLSIISPYLLQYNKVTRIEFLIQTVQLISIFIVLYVDIINNFK